MGDTWEVAGSIPGGWSEEKKNFTKVLDTYGLGAVHDLPVNTRDEGNPILALGEMPATFFLSHVITLSIYMKGYSGWCVSVGST